WKVGKDMADRMVERYIEERGAYPKQVGLVLWSTDTMKTGGDDVAYVLWLLGLEPVWSASGGSVTGLRVIPPKELGRPRIDVTLRISGLFRDSFPNLIRLIDEGIRMISELDETDEDNYLLANLRKDLAENISAGLDPVLAKRRARVRIFGDPPGNYGGGVDTLIESSEWKDKDDLKRAFLEWGGYAYGTDLSGEDMKDFFAKRLGGMDVTVKNHESRELDILDNDDDFVFLGGMNAAVEAIRGEKPVSMIGDSSDPDDVGVRTLQEEASFVFRSRVLNPKWVSGLKRHGYRGVQELSNLVDYTLGWDSTSGAIEDWMYEGISQKFLFDGDNRKWIEDCNPDALLNMSSRLLEAAERGLWNANPETLDRIRSIFTDAETAVEHLGQ
ncbi:MAG: cobaltochelatase subunit CobN, partial [Candidatus Methanomethylophilaceae archaeon]|nr:cobaltochelatase subunit CobN [Candidatus Methanomethylophilaceae archaeon]